MGQMLAGPDGNKVDQPHDARSTTRRRLGDGIAHLSLADIFNAKLRAQSKDVAHSSKEAAKQHSSIFSSSSPPSPAPSDDRALTPGRGGELERQLEVQGSLNGVQCSAIPDLGSSFNILSEAFALSHGFHIKKQKRPRQYALPNGTRKQFSGVANLTWKFHGESGTHRCIFHVLRGCVHPVILGENFLRTTKTFTKFAHRVKTTLVSGASPFPRLLHIDDGEDDWPRMSQRLSGMLGGCCVASLADTCSDLNIVRRSTAMQLGLIISEGSGCTTMVQLVDGSIGRTTGVVRDAKWTFGVSRSAEASHRVDFHVMDDLPCPVILSKWLLLDNNVFLKYEDLFFDSPVTHGLREETVFSVTKTKDSTVKGITLNPIVEEEEEEEEEVRQSEIEGRMPPPEQAAARRELLVRATWQPSLEAFANNGEASTDRCLGSGICQIFSRLRPAATGNKPI
ncbi:hypothetical protein OQA88_7432 [Cercophora sp. LCS_1]